MVERVVSWAAYHPCMNLREAQLTTSECRASCEPCTICPTGMELLPLSVNERVKPSCLSLSLSRPVRSLIPAILGGEALGNVGNLWLVFVYTAYGLILVADSGDSGSCASESPDCFGSLDCGYFILAGSHT